MINGIGTGLAGVRPIHPAEIKQIFSDEEFNKLVNKLNIKNEKDLFNFRIATKTFCFAWFRLIPLETFVFYMPNTKWYQDIQYVPLIFPAGEGKVYWPHVKKSWGFYFSYFVLLMVIFLSVTGILS